MREVSHPQQQGAEIATPREGNQKTKMSLNHNFEMLFENFINWLFACLGV